MSTIKVGPVTFNTVVERAETEDDCFRAAVVVKPTTPTGLFGSGVAVLYSEHLLEAEAQAAADAALAQIKAEMLRDLLSGPEWEGLAEALEGGAQACGYYNCTAKASLLRKLAETLEVGK